MVRNLIVPVLLFGAMIVGFFLFEEHRVIAGSLLIAAGISAIALVVPVVTSRHQANVKAGRFTLHPRGEARPVGFMIWGVGMVVLGIVFLIA